MAFIRTFLDRFSMRIGLLLTGMAIMVGAITGLAAVLFINLIQVIEKFCYSFIGGYLHLPGNGIYILVPVIGALLVGPLIAYFASEAKGHGVPEVMQALVLHGGRIRPRVAVAKIIASALCIGTGGSAGREGPIVQVGSTLGSTIGQWLGFSDERIKNLVACGAAAGIAATFNAPIAGVAFATEVLMAELQGRVFCNVVVAAVSASIISQIFLGTEPAFAVPAYSMNSSWEILLYAVLGLMAALVGVMFIRMLNFFENIFDDWNFPLPAKPAVGALLLGCMGAVYLYLPTVSSVAVMESQNTILPNGNGIPHFYSSGFAFIELVLQGKISFLFIFLLIFIKPLATSFTLGSGNSGGVFAPSLFTGAMLGGAYGLMVCNVFPGIASNSGAYALVGMAAVFAAVARAPLTAMLIVFEMSNDYDLILPLMVAGVVATVAAELLCPESIYTLKLAKRGIKFDQGHDLDVMQGVLVEEVMNKKPISFDADRPFAELYAQFQQTQFGGFPVTTANGQLYGIVTMQDVTRVLSQSNVLVRELMVRDVATTSLVTVFADEPVWTAIQKMSPRDLARLPVISRNGERLIGLISRSEILKAYDVGIMRKQQAHYAKERMALRKVGEIEFVVITVCPASFVDGRGIAELNLPPSANVISVERGGNVLIPRGDTLIHGHDLLTIVCPGKVVSQVKELF